MTPTARKKHLAKLRQLCENFGFKEDAYGNFLYPRIRDFRIKFKKVNVRVENKLSDNIWRVSGKSLVWSKMDLDEWEEFLTSKVRWLSSRVYEEKPPVKKTKAVPLIKGDRSSPIVQKKMDKALQDRNKADYDCYLLLQRLQDEGLLSNLWSDIKTEIAQAIYSRIDANDQFMRIMGGDISE